MRKTRLIGALFVFLFVCLLFSKPASAATVATNRKGALLYYGGFSKYIDCFNTKTGKMTSFKGTYKHWDPDNLLYHKKHFYSYDGKAHAVKLSMKGVKKKTYNRYDIGCLYKNYMFYDSGSYIRRCNLNGAKDKKIIKCRRVDYITVLKNKLYYVKVTKSNMAYLYRASLNGKKAKLICKLGQEWSPIWAVPFKTNGNSLYICVEDGIYQYYPGWTSLRLVVPVKESDTCITRVAGFHGNQIWFTLNDWDAYYLCKASLDTGAYTKMKEIDEGSFVGVGSGNYCFYKKDGKYYSMTLNGDEVKRIKPKSLY